MGKSKAKSDPTLAILQMRYPKLKLAGATFVGFRQSVNKRGEMEWIERTYRLVTDKYVRFHTPAVGLTKLVPIPDDETVLDLTRLTVADIKRAYPKAKGLRS